MVKDHIVGLGFTDVSEAKDRGYFFSMYCRSPSGLLAEFAWGPRDGASSSTRPQRSWGRTCASRPTGSTAGPRSTSSSRSRPRRRSSADRAAARDQRGAGRLRRRREPGATARGRTTRPSGPAVGYGPRPGRRCKYGPADGRGAADPLQPARRRGPAAAARGAGLRQLRRRRLGPGVLRAGPLALRGARAHGRGVGAGRSATSTPPTPTGAAAARRRSAPGSARGAPGRRSPPRRSTG